MSDACLFVSMHFSDFVLLQVDMFGAFICAGGGPVGAGLVVVVNWGGDEAIGHVRVHGSVSEFKELFDAFVGGQYFSRARALCCLFLADGFPRDGTSGLIYDVAGERPKLE